MLDIVTALATRKSTPPPVAPRALQGLIQNDVIIDESPIKPIIYGNTWEEKHPGTWKKR